MSSTLSPSISATSTNSSARSARATDVIQQLTDARRTAHEAAGHGREALEQLDAQNEILQSTEDTLEANEYVLQKSMRVLRGMTWSGWLYNTFSSDKSPDTASDLAAAAASTSFSDKSMPPSVSSTQATLRSNKALLVGEQPIVSSGKIGIDIVDEHLIDISNTVAELHGMSLLMADVLDGQRTTIDRIDRKTEIIHDKTLAVTLKASQITQRSKKGRSDFIGKFQFVDMESGMYLCVNIDESLELTASPGRSSFFHCFSKADNIVGIQNCKTLTFIGTTWFGSVKAAGRVFGKQEECHIGLRDGELTGLFLLSKNWGGGGWVKKTPPTDTTPAYFNTTTTSVTDKEGALVLRIILISREYDGDGSVHDGGDYGTTSSNTMHNERNQA